MAAWEGSRCGTLGVLPMCSIGPASHGERMGSSRARSSSNRDGQEELYCKISIGASALALLSFVVLMFVPAPYGRYVRPRWGPLISARVGWIAMEMPAVLVFAWAFFAGERWFHPAPLVLFTLWETHYVHRAFVYPFRTHGGKPMTLLVAAFVALCVTAPYGYLNGRQLSHFGQYPTSWLR
jgi:hypothetical protein